MGGVGRNIADCLSRLGILSMFLSAIGCDSQGDTLLGLSSHMVSIIAIIVWPTFKRKEKKREKRKKKRRTLWVGTTGCLLVL